MQGRNREMQGRNLGKTIEAGSKVQKHTLIGKRASERERWS